jgi:hypothetical protein
MIMSEVGVEQEISDTLSTLLLKTEALLAARNTNSATNSSPLTHLDASQGPINDVTQVLAQSEISTELSNLFGFILPFQDEQLKHIQSQMSSKTQMTTQHIEYFLQVRALDSYASSAILTKLIQRSHKPLDFVSSTHLATYLHYQLHLMYQLNDLVDAIVFAKDDLEAESFSPLSVIQRVTSSSEEVKAIVRNFTQKIEQQSSSCKIEKLDPTFTLFRNALKSVIGV